MFFFDLWFQNFAHVDAIKNGLAALGNHMPGFPWPSPRNIQDQVREMRGERCEKSWQQLVERAIDTYERESEFISIPITCLSILLKSK